MVTSEQNDIFGVFYFIAKQKLDGLNWIIPSVYEISNKDVSCSRQLTSYFEQFKDIKKLTMYISTNSDRCLCFLDIAFFKK
jgi:hypothetical protein